MKVIITGTTGMVGEGVLITCLHDKSVTEVLSVSRKAIGITHPKLKEYIVADFLTLPEWDSHLQGYDACFFCAGISSIGVNEADYKRITYDTTLSFARAYGADQQKSFVYVSGGGTDSSEKGRLAWARVKGKTENDLMQLPFKHAFGFRPGFITPVEGQKKILSFYKYVSWLFPLIKLVAPNVITTMQQLGQAMLQACGHGYERNVVEVKDMKILAGLRDTNEPVSE